MDISWMQWSLVMLLTDCFHRVALCTLSTKVKIDEFVECTSSNVVVIIVLHTIHGIVHVCVCVCIHIYEMGGWGMLGVYNYSHMYNYNCTCVYNVMCMNVCICVYCAPSYVPIHTYT